MEAVWGFDMEGGRGFFLVSPWCVGGLHSCSEPQGFRRSHQSRREAAAWSRGVEAVTQSDQVPGPQHVSGRSLVWGEALGDVALESHSDRRNRECPAVEDNA